MDSKRRNRALQLLLLPLILEFLAPQLALSPSRLVVLVVAGQHAAVAATIGAAPAEVSGTVVVAIVAVAAATPTGICKCVCKCVCICIVVVDIVVVFTVVFAVTRKQVFGTRKRLVKDQFYDRRRFRGRRRRGRQGSAGTSRGCFPMTRGGVCRFRRRVRWHTFLVIVIVVVDIVVSDRVPSSRHDCSILGYRF